MKISILGAGGWGLALSLKAHKNRHSVTVWSPFENETELLLRERENKKLLSGVKIPDGIKITSDLSGISESDIAVIATPSFAVRQTAAKLRDLNCKTVVNVAKGFEKGTMLRLSEVISEEISIPVVVLSGPSHAEEVARDIPTAIVASSENADAAKIVQSAFNGPDFRVYTNRDVIGVEVGGAVKNVIAVASGIEFGLSLGDNTRAALITRGLAEITRLGVAMGAEPVTFMGLAALGDLVVTCMSEHSRNNRFGKLVGSGVPVSEALETVGTVEGYYAVSAVLELAEKFGVDMPISEQCYNILYKGISPRLAVEALMSRPERPEEEKGE